jgi:hypothetical protein
MPVTQSELEVLSLNLDCDNQDGRIDGQDSTSIHLIFDSVQWRWGFAHQRKRDIDDPLYPIDKTPIRAIYFVPKQKPGSVKKKAAACNSGEAPKISFIFFLISL